MKMTLSQIWPLFHFSGRESIVTIANLTTCLFFRQGIYSPIGFAITNRISTRDMKMTPSQIWPLFLFQAGNLCFATLNTFSGRESIVQRICKFDHFFIFQAGNPIVQWRIANFDHFFYFSGRDLSPIGFAITTYLLVIWKWLYRKFDHFFIFQAGNLYLHRKFDHFFIFQAGNL